MHVSEYIMFMCLAGLGYPAFIGADNSSLSFAMKVQDVNKRMTG